MDLTFVHKQRNYTVSKNYKDLKGVKDELRNQIDDLKNVDLRYIFFYVDGKFVFSKENNTTYGLHTLISDISQFKTSQPIDIIVLKDTQTVTVKKDKISLAAKKYITIDIDLTDSYGTFLDRIRGKIDQIFTEKEKKTEKYYSSKALSVVVKNEFFDRKWIDVKDSTKIIDVPEIVSKFVLDKKGAEGKNDIYVYLGYGYKYGQKIANWFQKTFGITVIISHIFFATLFALGVTYALYDKETSAKNVLGIFILSLFIMLLGGDVIVVLLLIYYLFKYIYNTLLGKQTSSLTTTVFKNKIKSN